MTPEEAIELIRLHAEGSVDAKGDGLADVLWRSRNSEEAVDINGIAADIVFLLQVLQGEARRWRETGVPVVLSYAMAEITSRATAVGLSGRTEAERQQGVSLAWRISCAWEALMAGDVGDFAHVRLEERALSQAPAVPCDPPTVDQSTQYAGHKSPRRLPARSTTAPDDWRVEGISLADVELG